MSTRKLGFHAWARKMGATMLDRCLHEQHRFQANDTLCIVYEINRKGRRSCVPALAQEAFDAWQAGKTMDLSNSPVVEFVPFRDHADIVLGLVARLRAGEALDIAVEAKRTGFSEARIANIGREWGHTLGEGRIEPNSTRIAA